MTKHTDTSPTPTHGYSHQNHTLLLSWASGLWHKVRTWAGLGFKLYGHFHSFLCLVCSKNEVDIAHDWAELPMIFFLCLYTKYICFQLIPAPNKEKNQPSFSRRSMLAAWGSQCTNPWRNIISAKVSLTCQPPQESTKQPLTSALKRTTILQTNLWNTIPHSLQ